MSRGIAATMALWAVHVVLDLLGANEGFARAPGSGSAGWTYADARNWIPLR